MPAPSVRGASRLAAVACVALAAAAACVALAAVPAAAHAQEGRAATAAAPIAPVARAYLTAALDTLQQIVLGRERVDWPAVRGGAFARAAGAQTPAETYAALEWALRQANKHSFLQLRSGQVRPELVAGRYGYLRVPAFNGAATAPLADSLQAAIRDLDGRGACGWIVDLRGNGGGNIWPMQLGIAPLLDTDSLVSVSPIDGAPWRTLYLDGAMIEEAPTGARQVIARVQAPYRVRHRGAPVAVLVDRRTGSSGEGIAIAFRPRANTRLFGEPTAGYSTVNRGSPLPDGANMVVTVGVMGDRTGRTYGDAIPPDERVEVPEGHWPTASDAVVRRAAAWLAGQPGCAAR